MRNSKGKIVKFKRHRIEPIIKVALIFIFIFISTVWLVWFCNYKNRIESATTIYEIRIDEMDSEYVDSINEYDKKILETDSEIAKEWFFFKKNLEIQKAVDTFNRNSLNSSRE